MSRYEKGLVSGDLSGELIRPAKNCYRRSIPLDLPPGCTFMYREENNMGHRSDLLPVFDPYGADVQFDSADVIVAGHPEQKEYILAGAVTARRSLTYFRLIRRATNMSEIEIMQPDIQEGDMPEEVIVLKGSDWRKMLLVYAETCAERMHVKKFDTEKNLTGYCTWYYYYADVTEHDLLENLEALKAHRDSCYRADIVQIDDGYQTFQGDWNDQDASWPTPLSEIAQRITSAGMTAGIWLMPFVASTASRVFREHPDWFVKDESGAPKKAKGWSPPPDDMWVCLDMTVPAAREHIAQVFKTFRSWGFRYFKMDGLSFGLMEGRRADPAETVVSAFRLGLKAIREAVPDATLLGCCPPFMACLGYIDSARVSGDTHASWGAIRHAFITSLSRFWMIDTFFRCDPDTVMARQDRARHTIGEARVSALAGILTGVALTSDNLNTIAPERLELLGHAANIRMRDILPLDWTPYHVVSAFSGTINGKKAAAIANLTDFWQEYRFEDLSLDPAKEADEILQNLGKRKFVITVAPHDAVILVQN